MVFGRASSIHCSAFLPVSSNPIQGELYATDISVVATILMAYTSKDIRIINQLPLPPLLIPFPRPDLSRIRPSRIFVRLPYRFILIPTARMLARSGHFRIQRAITALILFIHARWKGNADKVEECIGEISEVGRPEGVRGVRGWTERVQGLLKWWYLFGSIRLDFDWSG
jgi:hypothetical protein